MVCIKQKIYTKNKEILSGTISGNLFHWNGITTNAFNREFRWFLSEELLPDSFADSRIAGWRTRLKIKHRYEYALFLEVHFYVIREFWATIVKSLILSNWVPQKSSHIWKCMRFGEISQFSKALPSQKSHLDYTV